MATRAFSKDQIRIIKDDAEFYNLEIIPYFQALSHCTWITSAENTTQFLEEPACNNWYMTWCPNNQQMTAWFQQILTETIELFDPKYIHLAMDEIPFCSWQVCDECKKWKSEELYLQELLKWYQFLNDRQVRMMIWHDLFLPVPNHFDPQSKVPGHLILDRLPKDIVMNVWTYESPKEEVQRQAQYFSQKGFDVLGGIFTNANGVQPMAQVYAENPKGLGLLQTYWFLAGDWSELQTTSELLAMTAMVGFYGQNPDAKLWHEQKINWNEIFSNTFNHNILYPGIFRAMRLALPDNWPVAASSGSWLPTEDSYPDKFDYYGSSQIAGQLPDTISSVWSVSNRKGDGIFSKTAQQETDVFANALYFIHATSRLDDLISLNHMDRQREQPLVGYYHVKYEDGTVEEIPLQYRWNITDWNSAWPALVACDFYLGFADDGVRVMWNGWQWRNPHPEKRIIGVEMEAKDCAIFCAGIYAVKEKERTSLSDNFSYQDLRGLDSKWVRGASVPSEWKQTPDGLQVGGVGTEDEARIFLDQNFAFPDGITMDTTIQATIHSICEKHTEVVFYLADENWQNYRSYYWQIHKGENIIAGSWKDFRNEAGTLLPENVRHFRIAVQFPAESGERDIIIREVCSFFDGELPPPSQNKLGEIYNQHRTLR